MSILWTLFIGGVLGWFAGIVVGRDIPGGVIGNIIAGLIGGWLGSILLGSWGPAIGGFFIVPTLIGAIIFILIASFILKASKK